MMKRITTTLTLQILLLNLCSSIQAQTCTYQQGCQYSPFNGNLNLANPPATYTVDTFAGIPYNKSNISSVFRDVSYKLDNSTPDFDEDLPPYWLYR